MSHGRSRRMWARPRPGGPRGGRQRVGGRRWRGALPLRAMQRRGRYGARGQALAPQNQERSWHGRGHASRHRVQPAWSVWSVRRVPPRARRHRWHLGVGPSVRRVDGAGPRSSADQARVDPKARLGWTWWRRVGGDAGDNGGDDHGRESALPSAGKASGCDGAWCYVGQHDLLLGTRVHRSVSGVPLSNACRVRHLRTVGESGRCLFTIMLQ